MSLSIPHSVRRPLRHLVLVLGMVMMLAGCEPPNPNANTPTSGHLVLFVDEEYAPMIRLLADTFKVKSPNAKIDIHVVSARAAMQGLLDFRGAPTSDTSSAYGAVVGRMLLPDEREVVTKADLALKEYLIAHDGLAIAVPASSPLRSTTVERLKGALTTSGSTGSWLDSTASSAPLQFHLPDQNSSTFAVIRELLLGGRNVSAAVRYYASSDSVLARIGAGDGVALLPWTIAHRDSVRVRTLRVGSIDSVGQTIAPVPVHPATLVTGMYTMKQPLVGYTFSSPNSLAVGFLAWLARSQDAQYYFARSGMQPENVKLRLTLPAEAEE